jgi:predicted ATPase with chaperone activity
MDVRLVRRLVALDPPAEQLLARAYAVGALSARGRHRVVRVARTIADLEHAERVTRDHVLGALALRQRVGLAGEGPGAAESFGSGGELAA